MAKLLFYTRGLILAEGTVRGIHTQITMGPAAGEVLRAVAKDMGVSYNQYCYNGKFQNRSGRRSGQRHGRLTSKSFPTNKNANGYLACSTVMAP